MGLRTYRFGPICMLIMQLEDLVVQYLLLYHKVFLRLGVAFYGLGYPQLCQDVAQQLLALGVEVVDALATCSSYHSFL